MAAMGAAGGGVSPATGSLPSKCIMPKKNPGWEQGERGRASCFVTWPNDSFQQGDSPNQELQLSLLL